MRRLLLTAARFLLVCGVAALFVVPAASAKPAPVPVTLTAACGVNGSLCPIGLPITFFGSGLDPKKSWEYCYTQVNEILSCVPVPLQVPVNADGTVAFALDGSLFRQAGSYVVSLVELRGRNEVFDASVTVAVG